MSSNQSKSFERAISTIRTAARRRLARTGTVSAVDLIKAAPTVSGARRGAAVRAAFRQLENEEVMCKSEDTVRNVSTRHRVAVYTAL